MNVDLQRVCERFSSNLVTAYDLLRQEKIAPRFAHRQDSALIFTALEDCRHLCAEISGLDVKHLWCRFTLGKVDDDNKKKLRDILNKIRMINPSLAEAPDHLSEFVFDLSISTMRIDEGYCADEPNPARQFQFLLVAESELEHSADEVTKDLIRLVAASAPLKVMLYNHWGLDLKARLTQVLRRCAPKGQHKDAPWRSNWLFLGVPTYTNWCDAGGNYALLHRQVLALPYSSEAIELQDQNGWWKW